LTTGEPWLPLVADAERLCVERPAGNAVLDEAGTLLISTDPDRPQAGGPVPVRELELRADEAVLLRLSTG
jgi:hypothetical protein